MAPINNGNVRLKVAILVITAIPNAMNDIKYCSLSCVNRNTININNVVSIFTAISNFLFFIVCKFVGFTKYFVDKF